MIATDKARVMNMEMGMHIFHKNISIVDIVVSDEIFQICLAHFVKSFRNFQDRLFP